MRAEHPPAVGSEAGDEAERRVTRVLWLGLVVLVISVAAYYAIARWRGPTPPAAYSAPLANTPESVRSSSSGGSPTAAAAARVEPATAGSRESTAAGATEGDVLHLDIRSQGLCWFSATVDGTRVVYRLMQPGEQYTIEVHHNAVLRVGDPVAFAFSINGRKGRLLGRAGEAVTVDITPQNYHEFLRRSPSP